MSAGVAALIGARMKPVAKKGSKPSNGTEDSTTIRFGDLKNVTGMLTLHEPVVVPSIPEGLGDPVKEPPAAIDNFFDGTSLLWQILSF